MSKPQKALSTFVGLLSPHKILNPDRLYVWLEPERDEEPHGEPLPTNQVANVNQVRDAVSNRAGSHAIQEMDPLQFS